MPRVTVKRKEYKINDFSKWLAVRMYETGLTRKDVGGWLRITSQGMSRKMKEGNYSYKDMLTILERLPATDDEIIGFMRVR